MLRFCIHYGIHFIIPIVIGYFFFKDYRLKAIVVLLSAIIIDADHILASPIFDPNRCSINFHPLHSYWAIGIYFSFIFFKKLRIYGIALLLHIIADICDCLFILKS